MEDHDSTAPEAATPEVPRGPGSRSQAVLPEEVAETLSFVFLKKAAECDPRSTLVGADLLKSNLRLKRAFDAIAPEQREALELPEIAPLARQWPHGVDDYERIAAAAEYLTLIALDPELAPREDDDPGISEEQRRDRRDEVEIARRLLLSFFMHTDSINVRKAQTHHFLMKGATTSRAPCRDDEPTGTGSDDEKSTPDQASSEYEERKSCEEHVREVLLEPPQHVEREPAIEFICMRRYSSAFPLLPRPSAFRAHGGGYLVRLHQPEPEDKPFGIAVDPGPDFIENLYRTGFSLSDIDMIVVTHDHVDHLNSLESVLSLMHYQSDLLKRHARPRPQSGPAAVQASNDQPGPDAASEQLPQTARHFTPLVYGNASIRARYQPVVQLGGDERFKDLGELEAGPQPPGLPDGFSIVAMSSRTLDNVGHLDLSKEPSYGICFQYREQSPESERPSKSRLSLAITSDTPAPPNRDRNAAQWAAWQDTWKAALEADLLVTHLSTVPPPELRQIARLDAHDALAPCDLGELLQQVGRNQVQTDAAVKAVHEATRQIEDVAEAIREALIKAEKSYLDDPHYLRAREEQARVEQVGRYADILQTTLGDLDKSIHALHQELTPGARDARRVGDTLEPGLRARKIGDTQTIAVVLGEQARDLMRRLESLKHRPVLHDQLAHVATDVENLALRARHPHRDAETLEEIRTLLEQHDPDLGSRIEFALWLQSARLPSSPIGGPTADLVGRVPQSDEDPTMNWTAPQEHPYLRGVLAWARAYRDARKQLTDGPTGPHGLFVLGELSEELGTVRGKIAGFINETIFMKRKDDDQTALPTEQQTLRALTSDVGLRTFVVPDKSHYGCTKTQCTTCSLDTDRIPDEVYHRASRISEVCVKGENEGIFYNCDDHDPGAGPEERFLEQLERFDVFGR